MVVVPLAERHAADRVKAEIEADGKTRVGSVEVGLLSRSLVLTDLRSRRVGDISIGRWRASGLAWPFDELLRGRTPLSGWRLGDPLTAGSIEIDALVVVSEDGSTWSVDLLRLEGFELAAYDDDVGPGPNRVVALGARVLQALTLSRFEEQGVAFTGPGSHNTVRIESFVLHDVSRGDVGSLALTRFEIGERGAKEPGFALASIDAKGIGLRRILSSLSSPDWEPGVPTGRLDLEAFDASGFDGALLKQYGLSLDRIGYEMVREAPGITRARSRITGFSMAPPLHGAETLQLRMIMEAMGLEELRLELECSAIEDRNKGELSVDRCALIGRDLGEVDLSLKVVDADEAFWRAVDEGDMALVYRSQAALGTARLTLADRSLLDRALRAAASTTGQPVAAMRAEAAREVRRFQPAGVLITEDMTRLLDTVARFIELGGTLVVEARPDPPFGLDRVSYLATPGPDLIDVLGVSAKLTR
ncbi:MAG: hypothetical protein KIT25_13915 [Enhydrobacter sp.]|nr:MAG: hypothetical protein KIT25_13915 [Enhydrobacter sp.]